MNQITVIVDDVDEDIKHIRVTGPSDKVLRTMHPGLVQELMTWQLQVELGYRNPITLNNEGWEGDSEGPEYFGKWSVDPFWQWQWMRGE